jgi:hypothetical protein
VILLSVSSGIVPLLGAKLLVLEEWKASAGSPAMRSERPSCCHVGWLFVAFAACIVVHGSWQSV